MIHTGHGIYFNLFDADNLGFDVTSGAITYSESEGVKVQQDYTGYTDINTLDVTGDSSGIGSCAEDAGIFVSNFCRAVTEQTE